MSEKINFNNRINSSVQIGDTVYVSNVNSGVTTDPISAGTIIDVKPSYIIIDKDPSAYPVIMPGMFILFSKHTGVNDSSLKGYYANVTFENYSNNYIELFAISSEITPSSK